MKIVIVISNNLERMVEALKNKKSGTIEAIFGDIRVPGSVFTWDHHGDMSDSICPCLQTEKQDVEIIGGSHYDLDFIGGCAAAMGIKPIQGICNIDFSSFWNLAAFVDTNGPHRLREFPGYIDYLENIWYAWCAYNRKNKVFPPNDGVIDVTQKIVEAVDFLAGCFAGDADSLAWGGEFRRVQDDLEKQSYIKLYNSPQSDYVLVRHSDQFVNHLYAHDGRIYDAIIGHNKKTGTITLSFERPGLGNAAKIMQNHFGSEAGGHPGIAGSPRGRKCQLEDAFLFSQKVEHFLTDLHKVKS